MLSFYATARYAGDDNSLRLDGVYPIEVWQDWRGRYCVCITHGYERKPMHGYIYKYRGLRELLGNWREINPESFYRFSEK